VNDSTRKILLITFVLLAAGGLSFHKYDDPDYYFHVASGRYIVENGLSHKYPFTFTYEKNWQDHEWLAQVAIYGFEHFLGTRAGPFFFTFLFLSLSMVLILMAGWEADPIHGKGPRAGPLLMVLLLLPSRGFISPRPYMIAFALAAGMLYMLERVKNHKKVHVFFFLIASALWANVHGSFPVAFGFVFAFLFVRDRSVRKAVLWAMPAVAIGFLLNPYHFHIFAVPFQHFVSAMVTTFPGAEWEAWTFGINPWMDALFLGIFVATFLPFLQPGFKQFIPELFIAVFYALMSIKAQRFAFNMAVLSVPLSMSLMPPNRIIKYLAPAGAVLGLVLSIIMVPVEKRWIGLDTRDFPVKAVKICENLPKKGVIRVFNPLSSGGYIEYTAYPHLKCVIDGQVYVAGFKKVGWFMGLLANPATFEANMSKLGINCLITDSTKPMFFGVISSLAGSQRFSLVHIDDHFGVYVRKSLKVQNIHVYKVLRPISVPDYLMKLSPEAAGLARHEVMSLLKTAPVYANVTLGILALRGCIPDLSPLSFIKNTGCGSKALPYFDRLVSLRPSTNLFHYLRAGVLTLQKGRRPAIAELARCPDYPACRALKILLLKRLR